MNGNSLSMAILAASAVLPELALPSSKIVTNGVISLLIVWLILNFPSSKTSCIFSLHKTMPFLINSSKSSELTPNAGFMSFSSAYIKSSRFICSFSTASTSSSTLLDALMGRFMALDWAARTRPSISAPLKFLLKAASSAKLTLECNFPCSFILAV
ncbi:hypothetical protein BpHYR1_046701 [Brachionus plicatilis]|uniref:Uncharacterized protein n=1 Tax=Brachionus plicatilis TaxID=10195 RepID=A0A3M7S2W0_BRAPC|nr:hypothetical protein BpHYR1_046701 [Brachionus plicatilis]